MSDKGPRSLIPRMDGWMDERRRETGKEEGREGEREGGKAKYFSTDAG